MGRPIVRLRDGGRDHYLEWSSIVDAPVSEAMTRAELVECLYTYDPYDAARQRLVRIDERGTSSLRHDSPEDVVWLNRAGPEESQLSMRGLVLGYVHDCTDDELAPFVVRGLGADDAAAPYFDTYERWTEHDNRRRASCGAWPRKVEGE